MTLNPIVALSEQLQKLINEHGSASILRDHLALFKDQIILLEKEISSLREKALDFQSEKELCKAKTQQLTKDNEELREKIQKYEQSHSSLLDTEKINILFLLHKNKGGLMTFQIAQNLKISEDIANYHLQELRKDRLIRGGLPVMPGQDSWNIGDRGTKYLIENKLIS